MTGYARRVMYGTAATAAVIILAIGPPRRPRHRDVTARRGGAPGAEVYLTDVVRPDHITFVEYRVEKFQIAGLYGDYEPLVDVYVRVAPDYPRPKMQKILDWLLAQNDPSLYQ